MTSPFDHPPTLLTSVVLVVSLASSAASYPEWFGIFRTVMMVLGGIVVIGIMLVVAVAIISGLMGMMGKLGKPNK